MNMFFFLGVHGEGGLMVGLMTTISVDNQTKAHSLASATCIDYEVLLSNPLLKFHMYHNCRCDRCEIKQNYRNMGIDQNQ